MSEHPLVADFDAVILDLDGCTFHGNTPIDHVVESIGTARLFGVPVSFLTNNSMRTPLQVASKLTAMGIPTEPEGVYTSALATAALIEQRCGAGAKVLMIGADGLQEAVANSSLRLVSSADEDPDAVAQGLTLQITWADLTEAAIAIQRGAVFYATNLDPKLPVERGFAVGNGSLAAAISSVTDVVPESPGKPAAEIFRLAATRVDSSNPITVGDQLRTDIRGAVAARMPALHVLTGVSTAREVILAAPRERPTYLGLDMRDLVAPYEAAHQDGEWWICGTESARSRNGVLELSVGTVTHASTVSRQAYRALAAAAWQSADAGESIVCPDIVVER